MITMMLQGGLGNQMFQYAFGRSLAHKLGTELLLDITSFQIDSLRQYNLPVFDGVTETVVLGRTPTIREKGLPYDQALVDSVKDGDVLLGYFQSEKYFQDVSAEIRWKFHSRMGFYYDTFNIAERILAAGPRSTFLTIRRTDYVAKQDFHGVLPIDYYNKALAYIYSKIDVTPQVFVFSDEPEWCQKNLHLSCPFEVVGSYDQTTPTHLGREDIDLYLMGLCNHAVLANSSFSWWGRWLTESSLPNGITIAPKQWFTSSSVDSRDIVPDRWIKI